MYLENVKDQSKLAAPIKNIEVNWTKKKHKLFLSN